MIDERACLCAAPNFGRASAKDCPKIERLL